MRSFIYFLRFLFLLIYISLGALVSCLAQKKSDFKPPTVELEFHTLNQGLSYNWVHTIFQDSQGYVWVGTHQGLNRYDGLGFKIFEHNPKNKNSLPSNVILDIHENHKNELWIATSRGLARFDRSTFQFDVWESNSSIECILEDQDHNLWLGTRNGLKFLDVKRKKIREVDFNQYGVQPNNDRIRDLIQDTKGRIWIMGEEGVDIFNPQKKTLSKLKNTKGKPLETGIVPAGIQDKKGNYWLATTKHGLFYLEEQPNGTFKTSQYLQSKEALNYRVLTIIEDHQGSIWAGSENGGLYLFDPQEGNFFRYEHDNSNDNSLSSNSVWEVYQDNENRLWIGTFNQGVSIVDPLFRKFQHVKQMAGKGLSYNAVTGFLEAREQMMWIATDGGGITIWNRKNNSYKYLKHNPNDPNSLGSNAVISFFQSRDGNIWAPTWAGGLNMYDSEKQGFIRYMHDPNDEFSIPNDRVFSLDEDKLGNLWVGTFNTGMAYLERATGKFIIKIIADHNDSNSLASAMINTVKIDEDDRIWVGAHEGLSRITMLDDLTYHVERLLHDPNDKNSISNNEITHIYEDSKKRIWVATASGLNLYHAQSNSFTSYGKENGLPSQYIGSILEDDNGDFWVGTDRGLSKMQENKNGEFIFTNYKVGDGLQGNQFLRMSNYKTKSGEIFFGGNNGFNYFRPQSINNNPNRPSILFTNFKLFNKEVSIGADNSPLPKHINELKQITLNYQQSVFSIDFIALNLTHAENNHYAYQLKGFDKEWNLCW